MAGGTDFQTAACASSEILARIGAVERLVAEREVRDDVVLDHSLEQRPLEPRGIAQMAALYQAVAQTEPDQDVAAKSFCYRHAFPRLPSMFYLRTRCALGQPVQD